GSDDMGVDRVALLERSVELHLADHRAQQRLRQLGDREDVVRRAVARAHRVGDLEVDDSVDLQLRVVARDADLTRHVERHFLQRMLVGDALDEGHDEAEARRQRPIVLAQPLDDPGVLLRHDLESLEDEDYCDDGDDEGDFHEAISAGSGMVQWGERGDRTSQLPSTADTVCSPAFATAPGASRAPQLEPRYCTRAVLSPAQASTWTCSPISRLTSRFSRAARSPPPCVRRRQCQSTVAPPPTIAAATICIGVDRPRDAATAPAARPSPTISR